MTGLSRRQILSLVGGAVAAPFIGPGTPPHAARAITAQEIVDRIKKQVGVEWKPDTVDTFKAGDPATVVTGMATTAMATLDVLKRAVKARANLVITFEPTFYAKADRPTPPAGRGAGPEVVVTDPVFAAKNEFIEKNNLVVWRFSDHWRLRKPDPLVQGLIEVLGWSRLRDANDPARVSVRAVALDALASEVKQKLHARGGMRVVGDPQMKVQRIALLPGSTPLQAALTTLPTVDLVIAGEVREWETVEYARDKLTAGEKKGLMLLGRVLSEEPGMGVCAQWLKAVVPELETTAIRVNDPYWRPL